jgi:hypothetical protein
MDFGVPSPRLADTTTNDGSVTDDAEVVEARHLVPPPEPGVARRSLKEAQDDTAGRRDAGPAEPRPG